MRTLVSVHSKALTVQHGSGAIGMVLQITPVHSRTTVVPPLDSTGSTVSAELAAIYDAESGWLDEALARSGQPSVAEIMTEDV